MMLRVYIEISIVILELLTQFLRPFGSINKRARPFISSSLYVVWSLVRSCWLISLNILICRHIIGINKALHLHLQLHLHRHLSWHGWRVLGSFRRRVHYTIVSETLSLWDSVANAHQFLIVSISFRLHFLKFLKHSVWHLMWLLHNFFLFFIIHDHILIILLLLKQHLNILMTVNLGRLHKHLLEMSLRLVVSGHGHHWILLVLVMLGLSLSGQLLRSRVCSLSLINIAATIAVEELHLSLLN